MSTDEKTNGNGQKFGGPWTLQKLKVLKEYLCGYTTALKNQKFRKAYIDAFAGSGYINSKKSSDKSFELLSAFDNSHEFPEFNELHEGSARIALSVEPRFDKYIYIDKNPKNCTQLRQLQKKFSSHDIVVYECDANQKIQQLCKLNWERHRAVMFLDPFGMQVEWETIEYIASTKAIDLWLFFPLGGFNRLLTKSGKISVTNRNLLNKCFGTTDWYDKFYDIEKHSTLFNYDKEEITKTVNPEKIGKYYNQRLKEIFAGVIEPPAILKNSKNSSIFQLCFAVGNERGRKPALRIAGECMKSLTK